MGKHNGPKFRTIAQKEELKAYGEDIIHRKLLQTLNIIANQLASNRENNSYDIDMLFDNIRTLDLASRGLVEVEETHDSSQARKGLVKELVTFIAQSSKE